VEGEQRKGGKSADLYRTQLRVLFPEDTPFHLGDFTRATIAERLDALDVQPQTRNRYKAAVSSFAKFLVRRGVLATNPVRDIEGFGEAPPRVVYYDRAQAKQLIGALAGNVRTVAALACAFAAEWGAIERATVADLDLTPGSERFTVRGSKTDDRYRVVRLVRENRWLLSAWYEAVSGKPLDAPTHHESRVARTRCAAAAHGNRARDRRGRGRPIQPAHAPRLALDAHRATPARWLRRADRRESLGPREHGDGARALRRVHPDRIRLRHHENHQTVPPGYPSGYHPSKADEG
jgi:hypothetical protein